MMFKGCLSKANWPPPHPVAGINGGISIGCVFLVVCKHPTLWHEKPGKFTMLHHVAPMIMDRPMTLWTVPSLLAAPDLAPRGVYPPFFPAKKIVENWLVVYLPL